MPDNDNPFLSIYADKTAPVETATAKSTPVDNPFASIYEPAGGSPDFSPEPSQPALVTPPSMTPMAPLNLKRNMPNNLVTNPYNLKAPQFNERPGRSLYQNAMDDISSMVQGTAALTNAGLARLIQATPEAARGIGIPGEGNPLFGKVMEKGMEDPDVKYLTDFAKKTGEYYNDRYIKPFNPAEGGGLFQGANAFGVQAYKHPIGTFLDLPGAGGMLDAGMTAANQGGKMLQGYAGRNVRRALNHYEPPPPNTPILHELPANRHFRRTLAPQETGPVPYSIDIAEYTRKSGTKVKPHARKLTRKPKPLRPERFAIDPELLESIQQYLGRGEPVPRPLHDAYERAVEGWKELFRKGKGLTSPLITGPKAIKSKIVLQNPLQLPIQFTQNAVIFGLTHVNSPSDVMAAATGIMLATNKKARRWIPDEFFSKHEAMQGQQLLYQRALPKWVSVLTFPDELMNKHLALIEKGDNFWRAAAANTLAVKELGRVKNAKQFHLLTKQMKLSAWAQRNIKKLYQDEHMQIQFLEEVHRTMGNYSVELNNIESTIAGNVMFYKAHRHLWILALSFPTHHPMKTTALHSMSQVAVQLAESEPMTRKMKEAGAVLWRDKDGKPKLWNGVPLVFLRGGAITPFLLAPKDIEFLAKLSNNEGLGDVDPMSAPFAPFWEITLAAMGTKASTLGPFKNPNATPAGGRGPQVLNAKIRRYKEEGTPLDEHDFQERPRPDWDVIVGKTMAPNVHQIIVQYNEYMNKIPGTPSDFSGYPTFGDRRLAPKRTPMGEKVPPMPVNLGTSFFQRIQPSVQAIDQETEEDMKALQFRKLMKSYRYRTRRREDD